MQNIYTLQPWTTMQRKWLERLAKQLCTKWSSTAGRNDACNDGGLKALDRNLGGNSGPVLQP
jgi:type I restriction enzyme R subunit